MKVFRSSILKIDYSTLIVTLVLTTLLGCQQTTKDHLNPDIEKAAILETLNTETKAFFAKDYELWQAQWLHEAFVAKSYMILSDSTQSETLGWQDIDAFGRTYMKEHPEPEPLPKLLDEINIRLYTDGAWVVFEQNDPQRGLKRETRLMEKVDGKWKIAGMHTTIY